MSLKTYPSIAKVGIGAELASGLSWNSAELTGRQHHYHVHDLALEMQRSTSQ